MIPLPIRWRRCLCVACMLLLAPLHAVDRDDDDDKATGDAATGLPALSAAQQRAVGLVVARAVKAVAPERTAALGVVLDPSTLVVEAGEVDIARAAAHAADAELTRLHGLSNVGAGTSQKAVEAAQAEQVRARAQADAAQAKFSAHWSALAALSSAERQKSIAAAATGRHLLLRADLPGRHSLGIVPAKAVLDVDGVDLPGRVLGTLASSLADAQGVAVLIEVDDPLPGLGIGARVPVALLGAPRSGLVLPRGAFLYEQGGASVYKQLAVKAGEDKTRYARVSVKLLMPYGDGWLVDGIDDDDDIVVHGAGVLWSLQGLAGKAADDDDD